MTIVIRSEKSVATRALPKIDGLLSVFSLIPSYRWSLPKRGRTGLNHDKLNVMTISLMKALKTEERRFSATASLADGGDGSFEDGSFACGQENEGQVQRNHGLQVLLEPQRTA